AHTRAVTGSVSEHREVVRQRVEPDVHDVFRIVGNGNAPLKRRPADAEILQAALDEGSDLFEASLRLEKIRMLRVEIEERLLILRQAEVIALFLQALDLAAAGRTSAVDQLRFWNEDLIDRAVPAFVIALVKVSIPCDLPPDLLGRTNVPRLRRA